MPLVMLYAHCDSPVNNMQLVSQCSGVAELVGFARPLFSANF